MTENKLIFSGLKVSHESEPLLAALAIFNFEESSAAPQKSVTLSTQKFGKTIKKILQIELMEEPSQADGFLIYKEMSSDQVEMIKERALTETQYKIYVLAHRLYHFKELLKNFLSLGLPKDQIHLICIQAGMKSLVFNELDLKDLPFEKSKISRVQIKNRNIKKQEPLRLVPFFMLSFLKSLLSPVQYLKTSQLIWLKRLNELASMIHYQKVRLNPVKSVFRSLFNLIRHSSLMTGYKSYGFAVDGYYRFLRSRHAALMAFYKSYGFFVDFYYVCRHAVIKTFYTIRYRVIMSFYKIYGLFVDAYYLVRHVVLTSFYKAYGFLVDVYYFIRHAVLIGFYTAYGFLVDAYYLTRHRAIMSFYKTYGFLIDSSYFLFRFFKTKLMYPFFKIYWFFEFQYNKRVRKIQ